MLDGLEISGIVSGKRQKFFDLIDSFGFKIGWVSCGILKLVLILLGLLLRLRDG